MDNQHSAPGSLGWCATMACVWEATAPKPGNVYRGADFTDLTYGDFIKSASAIGPVIDRASELGREGARGEERGAREESPSSSLAPRSLGSIVLAAAQATRDAVGTNTNLGTLLLIAPLACAVGTDGNWREAALRLVQATTPRDTALVYEAIHVASPGGMGKVEQGDITESVPSISLHEAMQLAAQRDTIALQYVNGFEQVWEAAELMIAGYASDQPLGAAIVETQLSLLSRYADSLIARKCGAEIAAESQTRAAAVLRKRDAANQLDAAALAEFDAWLRADGHRRNPGTTADLIAAGLFVLLVEQRLVCPVTFY